MDSEHVIRVLKGNQRVRLGARSRDISLCNDRSSRSESALMRTHTRRMSASLHGPGITGVFGSHFEPRGLNGSMLGATARCCWAGARHGARLLELGEPTTEPFDLGLAAAPRQCK